MWTHRRLYDFIQKLPKRVGLKAFPTVQLSHFKNIQRLNVKYLELDSEYLIIAVTSRLIEEYISQFSGLHGRKPLSNIRVNVRFLDNVFCNIVQMWVVIMVQLVLVNFTKDNFGQVVLVLFQLVMESLIYFEVLVYDHDVGMSLNF
jgi:hypothetical protein